VRLSDGYQTHAITEAGNRLGLSLLVVDCLLLPGIVPDEMKGNQQFRLVLPDGTTVVPESRYTAKVVKFGPNPNAQIETYSKETILFAVPEAITQSNGIHFSFKQFLAVELTKENNASNIVLTGK